MVTKSGFNKNFKDGTGGLRGGAGNASSGFQSAEKRIVEAGASVWNNSIPVTYWNFDEGTGVIANDVSSNDQKLSGSLYGTSDNPSNYPTWDTTNKVRGNSSLLFDPASAQLVTVPDKSALDVLNFDANASFSLSAWFKQSSGVSSDQVFMGKMTNSTETGDQQYRGYSIWVESDGNSPEFYLIDDLSPSKYLHVSGDATFDTNWHHLVVTYSGGANLASVKMYVDGDLIDVSQVVDTLGTGDTTENSSDFSIGSFGLGRAGTGQFRWKGNIDECAVWNKVLVAGEVTDVYNDGDGNDLTDGIPKS